MDELDVSTALAVPPEDAYEFLLDFPGYADYSEHIERVVQHGPGGPGTRYDLHFRWWKLRYVARSRVTDVDPPARIDWEVTKDVDAHGQWLVEPTTMDGDPASRVRLVVRYDPSSVGAGAVDLPRFVSLGWVVERVEPVIVEEGKRVVERIVADLEGSRRPVDLSVEVRRDA